MGAFDIFMSVFGTVVTLGLVAAGVMTFGGMILDIFRNGHKHA